MGDKGYRGNVVLVSPKGNQAIRINVPGRHQGGEWGYDENRNWRFLPSGKLELNNVDNVVNDSNRESDKRKRNRQNRRFNRLLSEGWHVATPEELESIGKIEKKNTSLVIGTTQTGNASHGGKHASGEVEDSPNAYKHGKRIRGNRGGRKKKYGRRGNKKRIRLQVQNAGQNGGAGVYSPQPLQPNPALFQSAEESAELLSRLIGRSAKKVKRGVTVDIQRLLVALETGDDPLPALESPDEKSKLRILVTPDCSGSTQSWNGLGQSWSLHLSKLSDTDVIYFENFNGDFWEIQDNEEVKKLIESVDIVIYLGDGDGTDLCQKYASYGATVLALDSYCASYENPRLESAKRIGNGTLYWVVSVSANAPHTWKKGIELCLER